MKFKAAYITKGAGLFTIAAGKSSWGGSETKFISLTNCASQPILKQ